MKIQGGNAMNGYEIQCLLKKYRIYQWELAKKLNISEFTLSRWLRAELNEAQINRILTAINKLKEEHD